MGGTRPADRPASAGRWGRQASTDHSHEDGERAVDAVLFTVQDPRTTRHRRVPTAHGPATAPENCETRVTTTWWWPHGSPCRRRHPRIGRLLARPLLRRRRAGAPAG